MPDLAEGIEGDPRRVALRATASMPPVVWPSRRLTTRDRDRRPQLVAGVDHRGRSRGGQRPADRHQVVDERGTGELDERHGPRGPVRLRSGGVPRRLARDSRPPDRPFVQGRSPADQNALDQLIELRYSDRTRRRRCDIACGDRAG